MEGQYRYSFLAGTAEWHRWGLDDRQAKRLMARWLRLQWDKFRAKIHEKYPGSMADALNNSWYDKDPTCQIGRIWVKAPACVVPCENLTIIEDFPLNEQSIREFCRVWGK
jgi:hypothetical protein